ncbi:MAG: hypothetical protein IPK77_12900 [Cellvibrio sp.]|nr:hypothetical protein [Cellvibrio sp.]
MAYYRILSGRNFEYYETYMLMVASFFLGWVLYRFVESPPVAQRAGSNSLVLYALIALLGGFTAYDAIRTTNKMQGDFILSSDVKTYLNYRYDNNPRIAECRVDNRIIDPDSACLYGEKNNSKIVLWGDSHADQIVYPLAKVFSKDGYSVLEYAIAGCPPITDVESPNGNRKCNENSRVILDHLVNTNEVHYVLLHAYWIGYFNENLILPSDVLTIKKSLEHVVNTLTKSGKEVFLIDSVPRMKVNPPLYMARRALLKYVSSDDIFFKRERI